MSRTHTVSSGTVNALSDLPTLKPTVVTSPKSFDPIDFVQTRVHNERARVRVLSSLAWTLDVTLIAQVRTLFFDMFKDMQVGGDIDNYNDYLAAMSAREQREANLVEQGFLDGEGVYSIRRLLVLRQQFHDAVDAAQLNSRYVMPTIEQLLANEKPQKANALTKEKLRMLADDEYPNDKAEAQALYEEYVKREDLQAIDRHEAAQSRIPAIAGMCHFIGNTSTVAEADFNDLPLDTRKRIITGLQGALGRALTDLAADRKVDVLQFAAARRELKAAAVEITELMAAPLFNENMGQSQIDEARLDKKLETTGEWNRQSGFTHEHRQALLSQRNG